MSRLRYTSEHLSFLSEFYPVMNRKQLTLAFNDKFDVQKEVGHIIKCLSNHNIFSGRTGRYAKGTSGSVKSIGCEILKNGYIKIKIAQPDVWDYKHIKTWKDKYGDIPNKHYIIFKDNDKSKCDIDNLALVSPSELRYLEGMNFKKCPKEYRNLLLLIAKIQTKTKERM